MLDRLLRAVLLSLLLWGCGSKSALGVRGDSGPGGSPDAVIPDATTDAGPPPTGCGSYPIDPQVLVQDESFRPRDLAFRGDTLFFGVVDDRPLSEEQTGGLYRVPTAGGPHSRVMLSEPFYGGGLLVGPDYLVYHQVRAMRTGALSWSFAYPAVVIEAEGRPPRVLDTELEPSAGRPSRMGLLTGDSLVFSRHRTPPMTARGNIGRYDVRSEEESTLLENRDVRAAVSGGGVVYLYVYVDRAGEVLRVDADGGVDLVARFDDFGCCWPWAADESALYLRRGRGIEAWPMDGEPIALAEDATDRFTPAVVDERFLYWADSADIYYVNKRGGPVETLVIGDTSYVEDLATDGCGVFFSVVNPPRVMVRSVP